MEENMKASLELSDDEIKVAVMKYIHEKTKLLVHANNVQIQSKGGYFGENWRVFPLRAVFEATVQEPGDGY